MEGSSDNESIREAVYLNVGASASPSDAPRAKSYCGRQCLVQNESLFARFGNVAGMSVDTAIWRDGVVQRMTGSDLAGRLEHRDVMPKGWMERTRVKRARPSNNSSRQTWSVSVILMSGNALVQTLRQQNSIFPGLTESDSKAPLVRLRSCKVGRSCHKIGVGPRAGPRAAGLSI